MSIFRYGAEYDAWLASACLPSALLRNLLDHFGDSIQCHQAVISNDQFIIKSVPERFLLLLNNNSSDEKLKQMIKLMHKYSIGMLRINDPDYPEKLKMIDDPPVFLFYQGELSCLKNRIIAVVGSRAASYEGQKATQKIAESLSRYGTTIVSGLACGIDASAHTGCMEGGSPTIAVTGCGLDRVYPSDNRLLHDRILASGGLLLSEYAPGEKPSGWHFPVRNRIITGISSALIVMEARIRSGSMTSVQHALDQGKDIFVYPGDPQSAYYEGNHQLLREGGIYFTSAEDILRDLHWLDNPPQVRQNSVCSAEDSSLPPEQLRIITALKPGTLSLEQLLNMTGMQPAEMMSTLTILQIRGLIEALPGKQYKLR